MVKFPTACRSGCEFGDGFELLDLRVLESVCTILIRNNPRKSSSLDVASCVLD